MKQRLLISGIFLLLFSMVKGQSYFSPLIGDLPAMTEVRQVSLGFTEFTPRSRLVTNAETGDASYVGNAGMPSNALGVTITHNVN